MTLTPRYRVHRTPSRMARGMGWALAVLVAWTPTTAASGQAAPTPAYVPAGMSLKYEAEVAAFEAADRTAPPPAQGILFIGSSIFRQWETLATDMAPLPVFNRAFGGSRTWEVLHYMDRVVLPYRPRFIVYYCGSNDVNGKQDAGGIVARITQFNDRVHAVLPDTRIFFVSVHRAPDKRSRWAVVDSVNAAMAAAAARTPYLTFIDVNPVLFDAQGQIRGALFKPDSLHFVPAAYREFTAIIKPVLEQAWTTRTAPAALHHSP